MVLQHIFVVVVFQMWEYILTEADLLGCSKEDDSFAVNV